MILPFFLFLRKKISRLAFSGVGSGISIKHPSVDAALAVGMRVGAREKGLRVSLYRQAPGPPAVGPGFRHAPRRHLVQALASALWLLLPGTLCLHTSAV